MLQWIDTALAALALAYLVYAIVSNIRFGPDKALRSLQTYSGRAGEDRGEQIGDQLARLLHINLADDVRWAQLGEYKPNANGPDDQNKQSKISVGRVLFRSMLYALVASVVLLFYPAPITLAVPAVAFYLPILLLKDQAERARKVAARSLPEAATLMAAEFAADNPPEVSLQRVSSGPLGALIAEASALAGRTGRPLLGRTGVPGTLVEIFGTQIGQSPGVASLRSFAVQVDRFSDVGVNGAAMMTDIARAIAGEYRSRLMADTRKLDSKLTIATGIFFFFPFTLLILVIIGAPLLKLFQ